MVSDESTVGYPVVFRSEDDVGAAAFVLRKSVIGSSGFRRWALGPDVYCFLVRLLGLLAVLWSFRSFN